VDFNEKLDLLDSAVSLTLGSSLEQTIRR